MKIQTILEDTRKIAAVHWDDKDGSSITVGEFGVTAIKTYGEPAEFCHIPHLAVYVGDNIEQRLRATSVRIVYFDRGAMIDE